jgi:signal transduction histidine kinase
MRWSLRYQLLVPLLTLLLGVAAMCGWTARAAANRARQQIEVQVRRVVRTLGESDFPLKANVLERMKGLSGAEYLLVERDGRRTATLAADAAPLPPAEAVVEDWQTLHLGPPVPVGGQTYLCSGVRLASPRHATDGMLYILYPEALWRDALWEAVRPPLVLGGFVGLASAALAVGVARGLGRRLRELERRTRQIAAGDFSPMPLAGRDDELRDLARSVNDMAQRLAQLQEAVQKTERLRLLGQVSGGLAHQLRNGVTGARLAVQLHARGCPGGDAEALDVALRQLALVEANVKRFLDLGRTEPVRREPCSLAALVDETVGLLRPQCRHAHIELRWRPADGPATLSGEAGSLRHLLHNLVGNAIEAAGPGGWVEVRLRDENGPPRNRLVLEVIDSGPGPPAEVAERLFEPFVTSKRDGVGLGLAVARQVVEAHGGHVAWRRDDGQTCFWVELPGESRPSGRGGGKTPP